VAGLEWRLQLGFISKRNLFSELSASLIDAKEHSKGLLTLKTVKLESPSDFSILPNEIVNIRKN